MSRYITLFSENEANMLQDAEAAIVQCGLQDWFRDYTPDEEKGFMFDKNENLTRIGKAMKCGHSGASYAWTMRTMQNIAKVGWEEFYSRSIENRNLEKLAAEQYKLTDHYRECSELLEKAQGTDRGNILRSMMRTREQILEDLKDPKRGTAFPYQCSCHRKMGLRGWCGVAGWGVPGCDH